MPYWSIAEWRARIGSSWCALGRPFKIRSPFRGKVQRALTLSQGVTTMLLLIMSIGVNLVLRALLTRGHHLPLLSFFGGSTLPHRMYFINLGLILTLVIQITSALVYQFLSMAINRSNSFSGDLTESLSVRTCFVYYSTFLILKMVYPSMHPVHWTILSVYSLRSLSVLWKTVTNKQGLVEKLDYRDADIEVVIMTRHEGTWVLAVAKAVLDVVLSLAASVILSLLLLSGDVEENPGPVGDINYNTIDTTELTKGDLSKIIAELLTIQSRYYCLGRSLNLEIADLRKIRDNNSCDSDGLEDVLLLWLNQQYDVNKHGPPTWRKLVEAVNDVGGGNDHELAKKIASNHPAVTVAVADPEKVTSQMKDQKADLKFNTIPTTLALENIRKVLDLTWSYRAKWKHIGIQLGIDIGTLDAIEANRRMVEDCLTDLISHWLRNTKPKPTRDALTKALQSEHILCTSATTDNQREDYAAYIKSVYKIKTYCSFLQGDQWPPPIADCMKVCNLAMIEAQEVQRKQIKDDFVRMTITGKLDDILQAKVPVELKDIFKQIKKGDPRKVLLEGAPGCGKSTLSFHICQQWRDGKLFQEYRLVILVRLRERAVHVSNDIADLLPRRNKSHQVFEELTASNENGGKHGNHILFILDGWDELPMDVPGRSIIIQLLHDQSYDVVITSRPTSSMSLYELKVLKTRIEILGFMKGELELYFASCLDNDDTKIKKLQQSIQKNPVVAGTCYLPLNASILLHLFKFYDNELPETQFEIFSALIRNCMVRHMKKCGEDEVEGIKSLDKLPPVIQDQFTKICKIAYDGVMRDEIIFESEDLGSNFNTLGLLQGVESLIDAGRARSYNFLHLSIQELLAAIHMATKLETSEQVAKFRQLFGRARFAAVFQFYAAKTKLKTSGIQDVVVEAVKKSLANRKITEFTPQNTAPAQGHSVPKHMKPQPLILSLLHCLYEAQDKALCELVVQQFKDLTLDLNSMISLNPADCLAVGYFLTHCKQFTVDLGGCSIGDDECKTLFKKGAIYDLRIL